MPHLEQTVDAALKLILRELFTLCSLLCYPDLMKKKKKKMKFVFSAL